MDTNTLSQLLTILAGQKVAVVPLDNTIEIIKLILAAISPVLAAITLYFASQVVKLKEHINSRMDELQDQTKKASFAEGKADQLATSTAAAAMPPLNIAQQDQMRTIIADEDRKKQIAALKTKEGL